MELNDELYNIINGKTVAYVCPGNHLVNSNLGEKIDSYDVVIRINQKFEIPENRIKDYGNRTDILMGSWNVCNINEIKDNLEWLKKQKYIVGVMVADRHVYGFFDFLEKENIKNYLVDKMDIHHNAFLKVGTICNSGFVGLMLLAEYCNPKKIFVVGMNFYNMGKYGKVYYDDYYDSVTTGEGLRRQFIGNEKRIMTPQNGRNDLHNQEKQIEYFKKMIKKNPDLFELDFYLKDNLWA